MQFRFKESLVQLVTLDMGIDSFMIALEDLVLVHLDQIECDIVRIGLNSICKVLNYKWSFRNLQELNG